MLTITFRDVSIIISESETRNTSTNCVIYRQRVTVALLWRMS